MRKWHVLTALICLGLAVNAQPQNSPSYNKTPVLTPSTVQQDINRIAGALEAANSKAQSKSEVDRAERDVKAQELMASWGRPMFLLGAAEIFLTFIGVLLVSGTLVHTKRSAEAAAASVLEAKNATEVTKAQISAYMKIDEADFIMVPHHGAGYGTHPLIRIKASNSGSSQAIAFRWGVRSFYNYPGALAAIRGNSGLPPNEWGIAVAAGESVEQRSHELPSYLTEADVAVLEAEKFTALFEIEIAYKNIFGTEIRDKSVFGGVINGSGPTSIPSGLRRVPISLEQAVAQRTLS